MHHQQTAFENIAGKEKAISPFPTMFSSQSDNFTLFVHIFDIIFLFDAELEESKIGI